MKDIYPAWSILVTLVMVGTLQDRALSEVIGFILILGVLVLVSALYLVYVVPVQGRDAEIEHMKDIEKFFIDFKMNLDSLWVNNQIGVPFNSIITLGTKGPNTAGSFSLMPLLQPLGASGTITITTNDTFSLTVDGIFAGGGNSSTSLLKASTVSQPKTDLIYYIKTNSEQINLTNTSTIFSTQGDWLATFKVRNIPYVSDVLLNPNGTVFQVQKNPIYDLVVSVNKSGIKTIDNWTVYSNLSTNTSYYINLLDEAYGLNNDIRFPFVVSVVPGSPVYLTDFGYHVNNPTVNYTIGELRYDSNNNYWIDQSYHYRLDGIFLGQNGITLPQVNPGIKISNEVLPDGRNVMDVYLTIFSIQGTPAIISESDPVQITGRILNVTSNRLGSEQLSQIKPNAKQIDFSILSNVEDPQFSESINLTLNQLIPKKYINKNLTFSKNPYGVDVHIFGDLDSSDPDCYVETNQINAQIGVESYAPTTF